MSQLQTITPTTILLADDHAIVRDGLRALLEAQRDFKVIGDAGNGRAAVELVAQTCPDVAILDIAMPELNGIEATRKIKQGCPATLIIILSMHASTEHIFRALAAGAQGYVLKESAGIELIQAVRKVCAGHRYLSQKLSDNIIEDYIHQRLADAESSLLARLSTREREILQLVVEGKSSNEIAKTISLSPKTVETYRSRLMQKLNISDLPSLVKFAIQHGITPLE